MSKAPQKPNFIVRPSKAGGWKHNVWVEWPDGRWQQVADDDGEFASEADAYDWIKNKSEAWVKKHPRNQS
jgi:hypothetical protein